MSKQSRSTTYRAAKKCALMCEKELSTAEDTHSQEYQSQSPGESNGDNFSEQSWHDCFDGFEQEFSDSEDVEQASGESEFDDQETEEQTENAGNLRSALANWAIVYGVSHAALLALLTLLSTFTSLHLPKDPRTLLQTPSSCEVKTMSGGEYFYFGLVASIKGTLKRLHQVPDVQTLGLQFNIDGIPLFNSARTALWPILCRIKNVSAVFTVINFCARVVSGGRRHDHISDVIRDLRWLNAEQLVKYHMLCLLKKVLLTGLPQDIAAMFHPANHIYDTRQSHQLRRPRAMSNSGTRRFSFRASDLFNRLLPDIRNCSSLERFRRQLKDLLVGARRGALLDCRRVVNMFLCMCECECSLLSYFMLHFY